MDETILDDWVRRLSLLRDESDSVFGETKPGHYEPRLQALIRFAWEEAIAEQKAMRERQRQGVL